MRSLDDTIAAAATPPGEGGIAIVRVSGPDVETVQTALFRHPETHQPLDLTPRHVHLCLAVDPADGRTLDEVLAFRMVEPHSYTRENLLEIQCHGGRAAANAVLDAVLGLNVRLAEPGEFTLRAFLRGRLDLVQAEAVVDVIQAQTSESLRVHEALLEGKLSGEVARWQGALGDVLTHLEAYLDFPEEELDLPTRESLLNPLASLCDAMRRKLDSYAWGRTAREGFRVAILGSPNVGKSSLLNAMAAEERAIVSPEAGTTRDTIEIRINACGAPVHVVDTAGLRDTENLIEKEGVVRARKAAAESDLVLLVLDGSRTMNQVEADEVAELAPRQQALAVLNKTDLGRLPEEPLREAFGDALVAVCAKSGEGVESLLMAIRERAWAGQGPRGEDALTRLRHRQAVEAALAAAERAQKLLSDTDLFDAAAGELHGARRSLAELLGWGTPEEVLDQIFSEFCIGK